MDDNDKSGNAKHWLLATEREHSILFTLPIELREMIYDFVFLEPILIVPGGHVSYPALLCLSGEIRREALPRFDKTAIFRCEERSDLVQWLRPMSDRRVEAIACIEYVARWPSEHNDWWSAEGQARGIKMLRESMMRLGIKLPAGVLRYRVEDGSVPAVCWAIRDDHGWSTRRGVSGLQGTSVED